MRIEQITFTRFIAAIAIVILHFGRQVSPFNNHSVAFLVDQANVGVSYFFLLSGFIMMISYGNKGKVDFASYMKNRFARIYPVYFLSLATMIVLRLMLGNFNLRAMLYNLLMIQAWIPGRALSHNMPAWSLSVELLFYVLFPFLLNYLFLKHGKKTGITIAVVLFWLLTQCLFMYLVYSDFSHGLNTKSHDALFYFPLFHLSVFLIGNLAGIYFLRHYKKRQGNYDLAICFIGVLLILALRFPSGLIYHDGLLAVLFVPFILLLSLNTGKITELFSKKIFVFLGEISYGIYILQVPVFLALKKYETGNPALTFFIKLAILLVFSGLVYQFIEKPLRKAIKKIDVRKRFGFF
jgi:peptidoglycan/LPS O-acetylase OafA/YrhL